MEKQEELTTQFSKVNLDSFDETILKNPENADDSEDKGPSKAQATMEAIQDLTPEKIGPFGVIHIILDPDNQSIEEKEEVNTSLRWLMTLSAKEDQTSETSSHLLSLFYYFNAPIERRTQINDEIRNSNIPHGVENNVYIIYRNATPLELPIITPDEVKKEKEQEEEEEDQDIPKTYPTGGTPKYSDLIGFVSFYYKREQPYVYIGHVYMYPKYRNQGVCKTILQDLLRSFSTDKNAIVPLFKADVSNDIRCLKLFITCGFEFSRLNYAELSLVESKELGKTLFNEVIDAIRCNNLNRVQRSKYTDKIYDKRNRTYSMCYITPCCFECKKRNVQLQFCSKCKSVQYCSIDCQKKNRSIHKPVCSVGRL